MPPSPAGRRGVYVHYAPSIKATLEQFVWKHATASTHAEMTLSLIASPQYLRKSLFKSK